MHQIRVGFKQLGGKSQRSEYIRNCYLGRASEGAEEEVEELLTQLGIGVAEMPRAGAAAGRTDTKYGGIEAEEEAVGVHGALELRLPLPLSIRRHLSDPLGSLAPSLPLRSHDIGLRSRLWACRLYLSRMISTAGTRWGRHLVGRLLCVFFFLNNSDVPIRQ